LLVKIDVPQTDGIEMEWSRATTAPSIIEGRPMNHYIDVCLEASSVCIVDGNSNIACEGNIGSEPAALMLKLKRIGLEAGLLSQWL
jgi:hypothetical protein